MPRFAGLTRRFLQTRPVYLGQRRDTGRIPVRFPKLRAAGSNPAGGTIRWVYTTTDQRKRHRKLAHIGPS